MKELSWRDRGRLWLRIGLRLLLWCAGIWAGALTRRIYISWDAWDS